LTALCKEMVAYDLDLAKREKLLNDNGFITITPRNV